MNMLIAMAIAAAFCIGIGCFPSVLYMLLPYPVDYEPYTAGHILSQLQLLVFSALAFAVLVRTGIYPPELRSVNLDFDWFYRRLGAGVANAAIDYAARVGAAFSGAVERVLRAGAQRIYRHHGPEGVLARTWPTGSMVLWVAILLASYLVMYYL